jgi:hypothetical protein
MIVSAWCSNASVVWGVRQVIAGLQNFDAQKVAAVVIAAEKVTPSFDQIVVNHTVVSISTRNNYSPPPSNFPSVILTLVKNLLNPMWKLHFYTTFLS